MLPITKYHHDGGAYIRTYAGNNMAKHTKLRINFMHSFTGFPYRVWHKMLLKYMCYFLTRKIMWYPENLITFSTVSYSVNVLHHITILSGKNVFMTIDNPHKKCLTNHLRTILSRRIQKNELVPSWLFESW